VKEAQEYLKLVSNILRVITSNDMGQRCVGQYDKIVMEHLTKIKTATKNFLTRISTWKWFWSGTRKRHDDRRSDDVIYVIMTQFLRLTHNCYWRHKLGHT